MVVVRESPRAKISPSKNGASWPPRSPFEALMASPSGKRRWEDRKQRAEERSPSPSPMRRPMSSSKALQDIAMADEDDDDEAEDEETLQLKLQQIEMKLKLKRLQGKKKSPDSELTAGSSTATSSVRRSPAKPLQPPMSQPSFRRQDVEVPVSPTRERQQLLDPVSPARARLGLTSVPRAQDVSLKRARDGSIKPPAAHGAPVSRTKEETPRPVSSFSERLAKSRQEQQDQQAKNERIERTRSSGFSTRERATPSTAARNGATGSTSRLQNHTGGERMPSPTKASSASEPSRSKQGPLPSQQVNPFTSVRSGSQPEPPADGHDHRAPVDESDANIAWNKNADGSSFDAFSNIHLSRRHIAHVDVARALEGSELYTLPRLLKEVKAPEYDPPDCESDFIVFGILARKSSPYDHKKGHRTADENKPQEDATAPRNKFMILTLVDLKWEIDLFLFGTAFDQFWKLTEGTLLAIQNPMIMPPKGNQNNGRFSLKLGSSEDRVMEIGIARDLGYCVSVKKDGEKCNAWIDKRSTQVCDFHLNLMIDKNRKGRMEVNTMWRRGDTDNEKQLRKKRDPTNGIKKLHGQHAGEHGRVWSVNTGYGKSAASILDGEDKASVESLTAEETSRRRIAAAQRERDLAKKLESMGGSIGADYLRARQTTTTTTTSSSQENISFEKPSASDLGLLSNRASSTRLSPGKDRKRHFGSAAVSSAGAEALGWGGAKKWGLLQPKETNNKLGSPEKGQTTLNAQQNQPPRGAIRPRSQDGSMSPKKRARFALDKGIREPGRESLGTVAAGGRVIDDDDDDDDLDIV